ncbi:MAG: sensor histidine kinase [Faecousia sp.]
MTKRIFRSIVFAVLAVLLASVLLILEVVYSYFTRVQVDQLRVETALAAHAVTNEGMDYFENLDGTMDCRITWIAVDGTVLYDNRSDSDVMVNHLAREEVVQALESGFGYSTRYSDTLMQQYVYAAERLPDGTVLRLSATRQSMVHLVGTALWPILLIIFAAAMLALGLANRLSQQIVRPLNELDLNNPLRNDTYPEIRPLLRRLDNQQMQLRQQRQELARRQREFLTVTKSLPEGLVLLSSNGTVLSINPAAADLLDVTPNCVGADFSVANRDETISTLVERALTGEKAEQMVQLGSGTYMAAARPVKTGTELSGVVVLILDLTQKQKAEALRREFTANVSHELKTPLHAISGFAELLKSGLVEPEDAEDFYEKIYGEAKRLIDLVEDILRLSRLDEGAADMRWVPNDLFAALQQTARELQGPAELAGVHLEIQGEPAVLSGVPQLHSAILFNLLDNAIKYNHPGGRVLAKVENRETAVVLTVSDTGMGIPEAHQDRIFERFYRVDKSHSKAVGGTGLGLSIVKHAVQILHGDLKLESTPGTGTTMTVVLPK